MNPNPVKETILYKTARCTIALHPGDIVVKSGRRVHLDGSEALRLAAQLNLPTPRIHSAHSTIDGFTAIRMDFIPGQPLDKVWSTMSNKQKENIVTQLRDILIAMRSLPPPPDHIGACGGGPAQDLRRHMDYTGGQFPDELSSNMFILDLLKATPNAIRTAFVNRFHQRRHLIVFSHGDLGMQNIMVLDNQISGLLDWESLAGILITGTTLNSLSDSHLIKTGRTMRKTYSPRHTRMS